MKPNPITEEIRAIRHQLAAEQGNDVFQIGAELRRRQAASGRRIVNLPARPPESGVSHHPMHLSEGSAATGMEASSPTAG